MPPSPSTRGEPKISPKPQPIGNLPFIILLTICTCSFLFILWRRANTIRAVVSHQLKTWSSNEGAIRLSTDEGPAAAEFLADDFDEDSEQLEDDEPLAQRAQRLSRNTAVQQPLSAQAQVEEANHP